MNRRLARDLQAWEAGKLSTDDLIVRYPSDAAQVRRLTGLFTEMRSLAEGPVPDATKGWNEVRMRMAGHVARQPAPALAWMGPRLQRRIAIGLAAALLAVPPVALAASNEEVRDGVAQFVLSGIDDLDLSIPLFGQGGEAVSDGADGGTPVQVEVGDDRLPAVPSDGGRDDTTDSEAPGDDGSGVALSGKSGSSVSESGSSSSQGSGSALNGAPGVDGGNGAAGADASGADGQSNDGGDAKGADATGPTPSPTPTPTPGTSSSGASSSSSSVSP